MKLATADLQMQTFTYMKVESGPLCAGDALPFRTSYNLTLLFVFIILTLNNENLLEYFPNLSTGLSPLYTEQFTRERSLWAPNRD